MKRIVIIGGGYAGTALARGLDRSADVVLVEPRDRFVHNVAAIRAVADPSIFDRAAFAYDRLLHRGRVIRERATAVTGLSVTLSNGDALESDMVVVATGSRYAKPFKPATDNTEDLRAAIEEAHWRASAAESIAIVGAGAVGTELAGELAAGLPGRKIHLINAAQTLFPGYGPSLGRKLASQLQSLGVRVLSGALVRDPVSMSEPYAGTLELSNGSTLDADLVFPVMGSTPLSNLLQALPDVRIDASGRALVDGWLRPSSAHPSLFALGDAASTGDAMTVVAVMRQAPWLQKTVKAVLDGTGVEDLPRYAPWPLAPILLPLGPKHGASALPVTSGGLAVGALVTSMIKGKTLFIPRYRKEFGYA
ncbi:MAG: NAD(P)/FAD-dependent oxidoreductase [Pseudomonadales bacterium]